MIIDGINAHQSITEDRIVAAVEATKRSLENPGICLCCGADAEGVEPDARVLRRIWCLRRRGAAAVHLTIR
jgi:hypothetical protein